MKATHQKCAQVENYERVTLNGREVLRTWHAWIRGAYRDSWGCLRDRYYGSFPTKDQAVAAIRGERGFHTHADITVGFKCLGRA